MSKAKPMDRAGDSGGGSCVAVEFEDGIAWTYLNRPQHGNALNPELNSRMATVLEELESDDRCRVLVLGGRGDMFSRGLDARAYLHRSAGLSASQVGRLRHSGLAWQRHLMYFGKPTIAMVHGGCYGAAFTPVVSCDIALAAEEARFGLLQVNLGTIPAGYVTKAVSLKLGHSDALYYIMTGSTFNGRRAAEMGLVNIAVRRRSLQMRTRQIARLLLSKNLTAVNAAKLAYKHAREMHWDAVDDYLYAKAVQAKMMEDVSPQETVAPEQQMPFLAASPQIARRRRATRSSVGAASAN
jgi:trans-feruloyl-CoA hydratase/vanillin synthase